MTTTFYCSACGRQETNDRRLMSACCGEFLDTRWPSQADKISELLAAQERIHDLIDQAMPDMPDRCAFGVVRRVATLAEEYTFQKRLRLRQARVSSAQESEDA